MFGQWYHGDLPARPQCVVDPFPLQKVKFAMSIGPLTDKCCSTALLPCWKDR